MARKKKHKGKQPTAQQTGHDDQSGKTRLIGTEGPDEPEIIESRTGANEPEGNYEEAPQNVDHEAILDFDKVLKQIRPSRMEREETADGIPELDVHSIFNDRGNHRPKREDVSKEKYRPPDSMADVRFPENIKKKKGKPVLKNDSSVDHDSIIPSSIIMEEQSSGEKTSRDASSRKIISKPDFEHFILDKPVPEIIKKDWPSGLLKLLDLPLFSFVKNRWFRVLFYWIVVLMLLYGVKYLIDAIMSG